MKRLKHVRNPHPDAEWAALPMKGEKQSGAGDATTRLSVDALVAQYPHSYDAMMILSARLNKEHPRPEKQDEMAAWKSYNAVTLAPHAARIAQFPETYRPTAYDRLRACAAI